MRKRKWTPKFLVENVEHRIAKLEATGLNEQAKGLRNFFERYIDTQEIEEERKQLAKHLDWQQKT